MAEPRDVILPDGSKIKLLDMPFETIIEDWNEYRLEDGVTVRMKALVVRISRILDDDGSPAFTDQGRPHVYVESQNTLTTSE